MKRLKGGITRCNKSKRDFRSSTTKHMSKVCRVAEYNSLKHVDVDKMLSSTSAMSHKPGSSELKQVIELPSLLS